MNISKLLVTHYFTTQRERLSGLSDADAVRDTAIAAFNEVEKFLCDEIDKQAKTYNIGDTGPHGGMVIYVDTTGQHGIEVQAKDYGAEKGASWKTLESCQFMIDGWQVPTRSELVLLYQQKTRVSGLTVPGSNDYKNYWTRDACDNASAYFMYFGSGQTNNLVKSYQCNVRLFRTF